MDICTHRYRYKTATRIVIQKVGKPVPAATVSISLPCTPSVPSLPLLPTVRVALLHLNKRTTRAVHPRSAALMCPLGSQLSLSWGPMSLYQAALVSPSCTSCLIPFASLNWFPNTRAHHCLINGASVWSLVPHQNKHHRGPGLTFITIHAPTSRTLFNL